MNKKITVAGQILFYLDLHGSITPSETKMLDIRGDADELLSYYDVYNNCEKLWKAGKINKIEKVPGNRVSYTKKEPIFLLKYIEAFIKWIKR